MYLTYCFRISDRSFWQTSINHIHMLDFGFFHFLLLSFFLFFGVEKYRHPLSFIVQKVYTKTVARSATKIKKKIVRGISHLWKVSNETMISKYRYVNCYHDSAIYLYLTRIVRSSRNCLRLLIRGNYIWCRRQFYGRFKKSIELINTEDNRQDAYLRFSLRLFIANCLCMG